VDAERQKILDLPAGSYGNIKRYFLFLRGVFMRRKLTHLVRLAAVLASAKAIAKVIRACLAKCQKERPFGYLVREAPADDVKNLQQLAGHLQENWFITKFRKIFARDEMNDDLLMVPARYNGAEDSSEYEEILPTSPP
jgi:hypothetical protein